MPGSRAPGDLTGLDALYDELAAAGWYGLFAHDDAAGLGRVAVQRLLRGEYVQDAEILRTADGRGWVIYADSQCPTCACEVRIAKRIAGTEVDLALALNETADELGLPRFAVHQHLADCPRCRYATEIE